MIQVNWINKRNVYNSRKFKLEECICFLTLETVEKIAVFMTKKIPIKIPELSRKRPVHQNFTLE